MINNTKNNTISESDTKKKINELNEIEKLETKGRRLIKSQKTLLSLFDDLKTIFNNDNNNNESNNKNKNENKNVNENENECHNQQYYEIEETKYNFKNTDETKSFKDQIDILKEIPYLSDYWYIEYYEDNKEINLKLFKLKFAHILNDVDDNLFEEIFGLTSVKLADKLINTTSKEENQMLINDVEINRDKIFEQDKYSKLVIQPPHKRTDLLDTVKVILQFNETIEPYLT